MPCQHDGSYENGLCVGGKPCGVEPGNGERLSVGGQCVGALQVTCGDGLSYDGGKLNGDGPACDGGSSYGVQACGA
jgi:hypothetical protein